MRIISFLVATLTIISSAAAVDVLKDVVITYGTNTPDSILDQAKKAIQESGGKITHEFHLIK
jgi:hypothetical protein